MRTASGLVVSTLFLSACASSPVPAPAPPVAATAPVVNEAAPEPAPTFRLPTWAHPLEEALTLTVQPAKDRFQAEALIVVALDRPARVVWLHGKKLHVTRATITPESGAPLEATWEETNEHGLASLRVGGELPAGRATIRIAYDAAFGDGRAGLYKVTQGGDPYAVTQFEEIDARRAFPCFDEPGFKIPYSLTLVVPKDATTVANAPEVERVPAEDGMARVRFATTPPLPSYLVAFAVGPFEVVDAADLPSTATRSKPLKVRVVVPKGHRAEAAYAVAHSGEILAALETYLGIAYPYEKLDLIATTDTGGAMENAGAPVFDEKFLLLDEATASLSQKQGFALTVAHELAHMWFGDLVTMSWWDDTWLNEAFATWMGDKAADAWNPESRGHRDLLSSAERAIGIDSLTSARSVRQPVASENDIENAFDSTTYDKGGAILSMFERWLGQDTFRAGVRAYLAAHRFGNASADDFLDALSTAAKRDVKGAFHTFLDAPGVPYVEASVQCDAPAPRVHLAQSRYVPRGSKGDANHVWQVPVCVRYEVAGASHETCTLLDAKEADVPLAGGACPSWVLPNADGAGYYRFALAPAELTKLHTAGLAKLTAPEKIALGDSLRAGYAHGTTPFGDALTAAAALADDPDSDVALGAAGFVEEARDWLHDDPSRSAVEAYARKLYARQIARLGWSSAKGETPETTDLRRGALFFAADTGRDAKVRAEARRRGLAYVGFGRDGAIHPEAVDKNLVGVALAIAGEDATSAQFDALLGILRKSRDQILRQRLLRALSRVHDATLAGRARDLALDPQIGVVDSLQPWSAQLAEPETRADAWAWLKKNWGAYSARLAGDPLLTQTAIGILGVFCDESYATDMESFFRDRVAKVDGGPRALANALETVRLCSAKRAAEEPNAKAFFRR